MRRRLLTPLLGAAVSVASGSWTVPATPVGVRPPAKAAVAAPATDPVLVRIDRLTRRHHCSTAGLLPGVTPTEAILRGGTGGAGAVRVVPFARGWASYEGRAPGTLVAVCAG